ncbi:catechol 2,3-dioxygenase-like lactoylglutathione lyase family enzyme [Anaerobacterium chartisolvens]|uniref:Catechol 2,3-dioxygenase-like lactoylglutathione lyase family enzyme n=1 Tax=Anaerobacterium chartisolvens TaxID=1297424 RepID=A0A369AMG4_9FIRM|nr:VOC family protein [Anaerobacterium chartisolvens]RCX09367.1 catechol 2,3-dioxygenase-like lactoylglutathione lyase family enzyme [Anaerobacterium chartisolvens]
MKYQGCLLAVRDISASKDFYEKVLHQNTIMDIGVHVTFEGFSLQQGYAELVGVSVNSVKEQSHNFQVYFEVEDLDKVYAEMKSIPGLQWVHEIKEYPWGQRDIRVYDPDKHIVEIAEDMNTVIKRFFSQGMPAEEVAKRTMFPLEVVKQYALCFDK